MSGITKNLSKVCKGYGAEGFWLMAWVAPDPEASASYGNLLAMQILESPNHTDGTRISKDGAQCSAFSQALQGILTHTDI